MRKSCRFNCIFVPKKTTRFFMIPQKCCEVVEIDIPAKMNSENPTIPTPFRGLRILLLDNDTPSLLDITSILEDCSYKVTPTEVPTIALAVLQENVDQFDLVMADINITEMDCFKFIKSVHDIKNLPIILTSAELKKDMVEEAMKKGACFFLKKPISSKNLKNVWQHVYRNNKNEKSRDSAVKINGEAECQEHEKDSDEKDAKRSKSTKSSKKMSGISQNVKVGKFKRKRTEEEGVNSPNKISRLLGDSTPFTKLLQETDTVNGSNLRENSHLQTKFSMRKDDAEQKMDILKESDSGEKKIYFHSLNSHVN